jgi:hypothetical protein
VVAAREYDERLVGDLVNEAVFVIDTAGPTPFEFVLEWLRFADAAERVAQSFDDQAGQALKEVGVARGPVGVIAEGAGVERDRPYRNDA